MPAHSATKDMRAIESWPRVEQSIEAIRVEGLVRG